MIRLSKEMLLPAIVATVATLVAHTALALEPANYKAGPVFIEPTLDTKLSYVDNLLRTDKKTKETGMSTLKPRVQAWLQNNLNTYSFTYELANYTYFDSSDDNFTDNTFNVDVHHEFNAKNVVNAFGEYYIGHEERGTGLADGGLARLIDEPVEVDRTTFGGDYTYGNRASKGRIKLGAKATEHEYQNFDRFTKYRSRDTYDYDGTFFWKVAPRTDVLTEVTYTDVEYDKTDPAVPRGKYDNEEYNYLVGVTWEATAKTSGTVKVGYYDRDYDSDARKDDDGFTWDVGVIYAPRTYSRFNLSTRRFSEETNGVGDGIDANESTVSWEHDWDSRSSTNVSFGYLNEDWSSSGREDDTYNVEATYNYAFRRWVDFGVGYRYEDRDSDLDFYDYDRNEVFVEAKLSL